MMSSSGVDGLGYGAKYVGGSVLADVAASLDAVFRSPGSGEPVYLGSFRKEPQMHSYAYEVIVLEKRDEDGKVERAAEMIDRGQWELVKPTREDLLLKNAAKLAEMKVKASEVVVNVAPFCG